MPQIQILDESTINQIAAGEVVERPSAVVKELIENAMDAGATAITAEIKEGGLSFIRITDNGSGIAREDIPMAFLRHATSKIRTAQDLLSVTSLGFRGEALSSIAAVSQMELITKTPSALNGFRYLIEGGEEKSLEEIGCPGGTTIIVRNLFYNTPARRKFLKSAMTEGGYISDLMERLMVSHPGVSFKYILNNQVKLQSSGNHSSKDILYHVYGRDITRELLSVEYNSEDLKITGFIGKPVITRGNRSYENYFINGRYIKSNIITKAIEEAYKPFMMQHKYPFTSLYFAINPSLIDVNVHPQKMEIRLKNGEEVYQLTYQAIRNTLLGKEMIPQVLLSPREEEQKKTVSIPEPFEENRRKQLGVQPSEQQRVQQGVPSDTDLKSSINTGTFAEKISDSGKLLNKNAVAYSNHDRITSDNKVAENSNYSFHNSDKVMVKNEVEVKNSESRTDLTSTNTASPLSKIEEVICTTETENNRTDFKKDSLIATSGAETVATNFETESAMSLSGIDIAESTDVADIASEKAVTDPLGIPQITVNDQLELFDNSEDSDNQFLSKKAMDEHRIIGQVFSTYWLVEYKKELYIIDQHAAHEKVLYEKILTAAKAKTFSSQQLLPPIVLTLSLREQEVIRKYEEQLESIGYEIEYFGGNEFSVRAVPADLYGISEKDLLMEFIDDMAEEVVGNTTNSTSILEKVASLSCKAAVKANHTLSNEEASALMKELLTLENPYHCPHGRPVIISMSQYELERKFKRII